MSLQDILMLTGVVVLMGGLILITKRVNPDNRRRTTYYSTKDVFHSEVCPYCNIKMKKTWEKKMINPLNMNTVIQREIKATPVYTCKKCGYEKRMNQ